MVSDWAFRSLIIPAADAPLARDIAATLSPHGVGMWTTGLAPDSEGPPTHFISTGYIDPQFAAMVPSKTWELVDDVWTVTATEPGSPTMVYGACAQAGLQTTLAAVQGLFSRADVSPQEPREAMARMGLVLVQEDLL